MVNVLAGKRGMSREPHFDGLSTRVVLSLKTRWQCGGIVRNYQIARTQHSDKFGPWQVSKTTRLFADQQFRIGGPLDGYRRGDHGGFLSLEADSLGATFVSVRPIISTNPTAAASGRLSND